MSTPTDEFAVLTIEEMPTYEDDMRMRAIEVVDPMKRAIELRDILSAFDVDVFPHEFQTKIFEHIGRRVSERPPRSQWSQLGNLPGTLLTWGSWDDNVWVPFCLMVTPKDRAKAFTDKLKRHCDNIFNEYESLKEKPPSDVEDLKEQLFSLARRFSSWSEAIYQDQNTLRMGEAENREADTLQIALEALRRVCNCTEPIKPPSSAIGGPSHRTRARATSLSDQNLSLFAILIKTPSAATRPFLLDTLEQFTGPALKKHKDMLLLISGMLDSIAPSEYTNRFDALQEKAEDEEALPKVQAASAGRKRGLEAESASGISSGATSKRGRKAGGR